jgi:hypothetical protein
MPVSQNASTNNSRVNGSMESKMTSSTDFASVRISLYHLPVERKYFIFHILRG